VAMESAGITLVKGDLRGIVRARRLSHATMRNIRQNLFLAFVYNALGVPVAAGILYPALLGRVRKGVSIVAGFALFGLVIVGSAFGTAINETLDTRWGTLFMFVEQVKTIWLDLFGVAAIFGGSDGPRTLPVTVCWLALATFAALSLTLLRRKIRAHEVVS